MEITLGLIAKKINGILKGDSDKIITDVAPLEKACTDEITFVGNKRLLRKNKHLKAGAVILSEQYEISCENIIIVKTLPQIAFNKVVLLFHPPKKPEAKISSSAYIGDNNMCGKDVSIGHLSVIGDNVLIGDRVVIHPRVFIGNDVVIGDDTIVFPNVTICDGSRIGNRVIIQAGCVIGSDGFGYVHDGSKLHKIPHIGIVQIDDDVELGACNTIDRGTLEKTWIQKGTKTDNLIHIAHNVIVGENTLFAAQVGIAGSTKIGKNTIFAGQAGVSGHLNIGDGVKIGPQAGVLKSVEDGQIVSGTPEMPHNLWLRVHRIIPRLPEIKKKITKIEKRMLNLDNTEDN
mmetsp:Transcript_21517/g.9967  ORF Transcript_21517/g.9967 Transcript_21517/m.9967 type:complete len:345 (+) Transcript_21517:4671-5705(+)